MVAWTIDGEQQTALLKCQPPLVSIIQIESNKEYATTLINNSRYDQLRTALSFLLQVADKKMKVLRAYQQHYGSEVDLSLLTNILLWRLVQQAIIPAEWKAVKAGVLVPPTSPCAKVPLTTDRYGLIG